MVWEQYQRANVSYESGDPAEAARLLERVMTAEPGNASARLLLALAYFRSAQLGRAETELRALVERYPSDHYAHHVLGRTLERLGRPADALPHLRLAAAMSPRDEYVDALRRVEAKTGRGR
ncbi:MAG TPA: tetratricopeptide repeat protein [Micromonosporaceae bacterium]|jgi:predicted Zn-dependent protease